MDADLYLPPVEGETSSPESAEYTLVGVPSPAVTSYMEMLQSSAPLELVLKPILYASSPRDGYDLARLDGLGDPLPTLLFRPLTYRPLYNDLLGLSEGALIGHVEGSPLSDQSFFAYCTLAFDPNRSRAAGNFMVSVINSIVREGLVWEFAPTFVHSQTALAQSFNVHVQEEVSGLYR